MTAKIECRMEFERSKKAIAVQGVLGSSGSVIIIDKRLSVKHKEDFNNLYVAHKEDFDNLYVALDKFKEMVYELVEREYCADMVADTTRKCQGE